MNRDPGLQPERTWLAWRRTTASAAAVTLLLLHSAAHSSGDLTVIPAGAGILVTISLALLTRQRERHLLRAQRTPPDAAHPQVIGLAAALLTIMAVATIVFLA
ncbi:DUF202 domain-containing protein [Amycolatopsis sp. 195334CR]|uniref:DUF202 domain-containing protein n=1 Tax=Amycolatopsis sp. 195334CR TaxID=2814588 RepID=UPI001A8F1A21|nr:DUF202 domain-containing protein [Amycolatopsis sp. 195334CR]MBN6033579.1 DUF202 domain-containing protein [Amycolatopsis sp. 195334CR]